MHKQAVKPTLSGPRSDHPSPENHATPQTTAPTGSVPPGKIGSPVPTRSLSNVASPVASRARASVKSNTSNGTLAAPDTISVTGPTAPHLDHDDHIMGVIIEGVPMKDVVESSHVRPNTAEKETNTNDDLMVHDIRKMLLFAVAYSTNIGGTGSLVGTGPIKVFKELVKEYG